MSERGGDKRGAERARAESARKSNPSGRPRRLRGRVLAAYGDTHGRPHRVVLRGQFVLDVCDGELPRVVCELGQGEGEAEARATLEAGGYLDRARSATEPFCRALAADDLRPPNAAGGEQAPDELGEERERWAA